MNLKTFKSVILSSIILLVVGCQDNEVVDPVFKSMKITSYETGAVIDAANIPVGKQMKYFIETDADLCVLWPAGKRDILKSKLDATKDSVNVYGDVVLNGNGASDDYRDYGLYGAKGVTTSGSRYVGYSTTYTFTKTGTYNLVIVLSAHGTDGPDYKQIKVEQTLTVK